MANSSSGDGGCVSLLLLATLLTALLSTFFWTQGMDPQSALETGLLYSVRIIGGIAAGLCIFGSIVLGLIGLIAVYRFCYTRLGGKSNV